jgi:DNA-binding SARP family transcriptional activator/predicted negative regulator of RcsB-dependent stress response
MVSLKLFGRASIEAEGRPLAGKATHRHRLALLALLAAARGQILTRDKLIGLLWPESDTERARHLLNASVYELRKALGETALLSAGDELRLGLDVIRVDVVEFEAALYAGRLEPAIELYVGAFLDGFFLPDNVEFESWAAHERERLVRAYVGALERLAERAEGAGDPRGAARWWHRLCAEEPDHSRAVLGLMAALAATGDRAGALRHAARHAEHLKSEYGAMPDPTVTALAVRLQAEPDAWVPPAAAVSESSRAGVASPAGGLPREGPRRRRMPPRSAVVLGVGVGVAGLMILYLAVGGWNTKLSIREGEAGIAPGIAVMPFQVADPDLAAWREEIVVLLTANLDGTHGLRAISSRTVLAQWREGVPEGQVPDLSTTLKIARESGGSYAVVGSAVAVGPNVRLSAEVYEIVTGRGIGAARAEGSPDSLYSLVDRLSLEILRAILEEDAEKLPAVPDLASVTTASLPALKAYLEGEALYRKADFENAISAYQRAVTADSTFASAWLRLAGAEWWLLNDLEIVADIDRALALSDRLSDRDVRLATVARAFLLGNKSRARELAERFVHNWYPDDPEFWFLLALTFGDEFNDATSPGDPADGQQALLRAVSLDPTFAPYRRELLYRSFWEADRDRVAEQLAALERLAQQDDEKVKAGRLAFALAWGDSSGRARAWAATDTLDPEFLRQIGMFLNNGRFLPITEALFRQPQARVVTTRTCTTCCFPCLSTILVWEGKFQEVIRLLEQPAMQPSGRRWWSYHLHFFGVALPGQLEHDLVSQPADTVGWFFAGAYAADRGRWPEHAAAVLAFRGVAHEAGRDSIDAHAFAGAANALEGYGLWRRGRAREGLALLIAGQPDMIGQCAAVVPNQTVRRWIGLLLLELGRPAEAVPYLQTLWPGSIVRDPLAAYEMGRAYAALGENQKAIQAYEEALAAWRDADPLLKPRIDNARREIARLRGESAMSRSYRIRPVNGR